MEYFVEFLSGKEAERYARFFKRDVFFMRFLSGLGCVLVSDIRIERGYEHKRVVKVMRHLFFVRSDTGHAVIVERNYAVREKFCGLKEVIDDYRHEYVKFEVALRSAQIGRASCRERV